MRRRRTGAAALEISHVGAGARSESFSIINAFLRPKGRSHTAVPSGTAYGGRS
jgi:hypothetical protein